MRFKNSLHIFSLKRHYNMLKNLETREIKVFFDSIEQKTIVTSDRENEILMIFKEILNELEIYFKFK